MIGLLVDAIVRPIVRCLLLYPLGLIRMWVIGKRKTSFRSIMRENEFRLISAQGGVLMMDIFAATGSVVLVLLLIIMIGTLIWSLFNLTGII